MQGLQPFLFPVKTSSVIFLPEALLFKRRSLFSKVGFECFPPDFERNSCSSCRRLVRPTSKQTSCSIGFGGEDVKDEEELRENAMQRANGQGAVLGVVVQVACSFNHLLFKFL